MNVVEHKIERKFSIAVPMTIKQLKAELANPNMERWEELFNGRLNRRGLERVENRPLRILPRLEQFNLQLQVGELDPAGPFELIVTGWAWKVTNSGQSKV